MSLGKNRTAAVVAVTAAQMQGTQRLDADEGSIAWKERIQSESRAAEGLAARPVLVTRNFIAHPTSLHQQNRTAYQELSPKRNGTYQQQGHQQQQGQGQSQSDSPSHGGFGRTNAYQQQSPMRSLQPSPSEARFRSPQQMGAGATLSPVNNRGLNHSRSEGGLLHSSQRLQQQQQPSAQQHLSPQGYGASGQRAPATGMLPQLHSPSRMATGSNVASPHAQQSQAQHVSRHSSQIQYVHSEPSERAYPAGQGEEQEQVQGHEQGQRQGHDDEWQERVQQQLEQQEQQTYEQRGHDGAAGLDGAAEGGAHASFADDAAQAAFEADQALRAEQEHHDYDQHQQQQRQQQGHDDTRDYGGRDHGRGYGQESSSESDARATDRDAYHREQEEYQQFLQWKGAQQQGQGQQYGYGEQQQQQHGYSPARDPNPYAHSAVRQLSVVSRPGTQSRAQAHTFLAWSPGAARLGRRNPINRSSANPLWHEGQTSSETFLQSHSQQSFNAGGWRPRPSPVPEASVFRANTESRDNFKAPPPMSGYASRAREAELAKQKAEQAHYSPILGNLVGGRALQHQGQGQGQQQPLSPAHQYASPTKFPTLHLRA